MKDSDWVSDDEIKAIARYNFTGPHAAAFAKYVRENQFVQSFWFSMAIIEAALILVAIIARVMR